MSEIIKIASKKCDLAGIFLSKCMTCYEGLTNKCTSSLLRGNYLKSLTTCKGQYFLYLQNILVFFSTPLPRIASPSKQQNNNLSLFPVQVISPCVLLVDFMTTVMKKDVVPNIWQEGQKKNMKLALLPLFHASKENLQHFYSHISIITSQKNSGNFC